MAEGRGRGRRVRDKHHHARRASSLPEMVETDASPPNPPKINEGHWNARHRVWRRLPGVTTGSQYMFAFFLLRFAIFLFLGGWGVGGVVFCGAFGYCFSNGKLI